MIQLDETASKAPERPDLAVPIKKSITPMDSMCLEDGMKLKMLKQYPNVRSGMAPDEYRARRDLLGHYPIVATEYGKIRSNLAKLIGLGRRGS